MSFKRGTTGLCSQQQEDVLNPLDMSYDKISEDIIGIHDSQTKRQDVDSLYSFVSNVVKNSTRVGEFLGVKNSKMVELVEDKVPQSTFMPPFSTLKEIACQMRCQSFNPNTAHKAIVEILKKLESYTWDAKAVIALSAFSLDYGESLRLSLMEATNKDSFELHVFRLGAVDKDKLTQLKSLVDLALQMIRKIIDLEKQIADENLILKNVPGLSAMKREIFTYWAIFALAFASQITEREWDIPKVLTKLGAVSLELDDVMKKLKQYKGFASLYSVTPHLWWQ